MGNKFFHGHGKNLSKQTSNKMSKQRSNKCRKQIDVHRGTGRNGGRRADGRMGRAHQFFQPLFLNVSRPLFRHVVGYFL